MSALHPGRAMARQGIVAEARDALPRLVRSDGRTNLVLAAAIVIPLLANIIFLFAYLNGAGQRASLAHQLQEAQQKLVDQAKARPGASTTPVANAIVVPEDIQSADVMDLFLKLAQESAVEVAGLSQKGITTEKFEGADFRAFHYTVEVRARVSQLVAFLNRLEQVQYSTMVIDNLTAKPSAGQNWSISLELVTYAKGSKD